MPHRCGFLFGTTRRMKTSLQSEIEQRIGRNLLRFQLVELRLKQALPLRKVTVSQDGIKELQESVDAVRQQTLGQLAKSLIEALEFSPDGGREAFKASLQEFIDARNWLAHHLLRDFGLLQTEDSAWACIARLDTDYAAAERVARHVLDLHQFILTSLQGFLENWDATSPMSPSKMIEIGKRQAAQIASLNGSQVSVQVQVPIEEAFQEVMSLIETAHRRPDGWTIFTPVGIALRQHYIDVPPGLLKLARQVSGFDFELREVRPGAGAAWMFRSQIADASM